MSPSDCYTATYTANTCAHPQIQCGFVKYEVNPVEATDCKIKRMEMQGKFWGWYMRSWALGAHAPFTGIWKPLEKGPGV